MHQHNETTRLTNRVEDQPVFPRPGFSNAITITKNLDSILNTSRRRIRSGLRIFHPRPQRPDHIEQQIRIGVQHLRLGRQRDFVVVESQPLVVAPAVADVVAGVHLADVHDHAREVVPAGGAGRERGGGGEGFGGEGLLFAVLGGGVGGHVELEGVG